MEGRLAKLHREAEAVLALWRAVERELESAPPEAPEREALQSEAATLRDEYQRIVDRDVTVGEPEPAAG